MKGYEFHPEAEIDLDTIWEFIAEDNPDAADRIIDEIEATIEALVPFPHQGHRRPDLTSRSLRFMTAGNLPDCLRAGQSAAVDCRRHAWAPQPSRNGSDPERARVAPTVS
ncbi:MAG: type II toxin-antitoxin system RelE/ParE family toxin [Bryobacteraceae bacterium]|jgi:plasmid stabilization system protein ParE